MGIMKLIRIFFILVYLIWFEYRYNYFNYSLVKGLLVKLNEDYGLVVIGYKFFRKV